MMPDNDDIPKLKPAFSNDILSASNSLKHKTEGSYDTWSSAYTIQSNKISLLMKQLEQENMLIFFMP